MEDYNSFYKNLLDNLYDGVYFVDRNLRITYWNKGAERISGFSSSEVVGTRCTYTLMAIDEHGRSLCGELCPLAKTLADGIPRDMEVYIHHRDGYRVPVLVRVAPILDAQGHIIGGVEIFSDNSSKVAALRRVRELEEVAYIDLLTGLANRRYAEISLRARLDEMPRYGWTFGILLSDVDHFRRINDRYGREGGNKVLQMVSQTLLKNTRSFDLVGRWGRQEFICIIVSVDKGQLHSIAERFRMLVEQSSLPVGSDVVRVTTSIGATLARPDDTAATLLARADKLMYQSKASGGNRISMD